MSQDRRNRIVTLTLPTVPDRERAVRAARRWFEVCPEPLHGRFGTAVRAGDTAVTGPVNVSVGIAIWDGVHKEPWEWSEPYSPAAFGELLQRLGRLPDVADFEAWTPDHRGWRTAGPCFSIGMIREDGYVDMSSTVDDAVADRAILAAVREVAEVGAPLAVAIAVGGSLREMPL